MDCSLVTVRHVVGGYAARLRASAALARVVSLAVVNLRGRIGFDFCPRQLSKNLQNNLNIGFISMSRIISVK